MLSLAVLPVMRILYRAIAKAGASIISPIPSLAAHIESYENYLSQSTEHLDSHEYVSLYHDWFAEAADLLRKAKQMKWNLWTLVEYYNTKNIITSNPGTDSAAATGNLPFRCYQRLR